MSSDSDSTINSDECKSLIPKSKPSSNFVHTNMFQEDLDSLHKVTSSKNKSSPKHFKKHSRKLHDISDSDSENDDIINFQSKLHNCKSDVKINDCKQNVVDKKGSSQDNTKPFCKYGKLCFRQNPAHFKQFAHPSNDQSDFTSPPSNKKRKCIDEISVSSSTVCSSLLNFYLTKVNGIPEKFNQIGALDIKDILSVSHGKLKASAQFNFKIDVPWLMQQYPPQFRACPLLIVHGAQREEKKELEKSAEPYKNVTFCQAKLEIMYGTHHTKMMLLLYEEGMRVVIHTANLILGDWFQKTQGIWMSPMFPLMKGKPSILDGESKTSFKANLIEYISFYENKDLIQWCQHIKAHDLSDAKVHFIGSVPGRHTERKTNFGHLKLRKVLGNYSSDKINNQWPLVGQFSSIGSLGNTPEQWLCGEWLASMSAVKSGTKALQGFPLKLIYPTVENVRTSLEGYPAGGSLPYSYKTAMKQTYLKKFLHQWHSECRGRSKASPHIKTYFHMSPDQKNAAWFLVTSANLSKAAWGAFEKNSTQLMIRSYEAGVLFMPQNFGSHNLFNVKYTDENNYLFFPFPYDIPLVPYEESDHPWIWDIPHTNAPDRNGNMWCPR